MGSTVLSRRAAVRGAVWSMPAVTVATTAPAFAQHLGRHGADRTSRRRYVGPDQPGRSRRHGRRGAVGAARHADASSGSSPVASISVGVEHPPASASTRYARGRAGPCVYHRVTAGPFYGDASTSGRGPSSPWRGLPRSRRSRYSSRSGRRRSALGVSRRRSVRWPRSDRCSSSASTRRPRGLRHRRAGRCDRRAADGRADSPPWDGCAVAMTVPTAAYANPNPPTVSNLGARLEGGPAPHALRRRAAGGCCRFVTTQASAHLADRTRQRDRGPGAFSVDLDARQLRASSRPT